MIIDNSSNDVILFNYYFMNGAVIDALEYYLCARKYSDNTYLYIIYFNDKNKIINMINNIILDRYTIDKSYLNNIVYIKNNDLSLIKVNNLLLLDIGTFHSLPYFVYKKLILLVDPYNIKTNLKRYMLYTNRKTIYLFNEMPTMRTLEINYKFKFLFNNYKHYDTFDNNVFYSSNSKGLPDKEKIFKLLDYIKPEQKLIIGCKYGLVPNYIDDRIIYNFEHPKDFQSKFNTYLYYHFGEYMDPRPRLFHESVYYNKNVIYINKNKIKDGSWYRYTDAVVNKDINERYLNENDEAITILNG